jgi:hypothetical protein
MDSTFLVMDQDLRRSQLMMTAPTVSTAPPDASATMSRQDQGRHRHCRDDGQSQHGHAQGGGPADRSGDLVGGAGVEDLPDL